MDNPISYVLPILHIFMFLMSPQIHTHFYSGRMDVWFRMSTLAVFEYHLLSQANMKKGFVKGNCRKLELWEKERRKMNHFNLYIAIKNNHQLCTASKISDSSIRCSRILWSPLAEIPSCSRTGSEKRLSKRYV